MTKEDWIILRMLKGWFNAHPANASKHPDYVRTLVYMCNKYGLDKTCDALAQISPPLSPK